MNKLIVCALFLSCFALVLAVPRPAPQRAAVAESKIEDLEAGDSEKDDLKGSASYGYGYYGGLGGYYGGGYYPYHGAYGYPYYSYGLGYPYYGGYGLHGHYY
uniref:Uncharacterized protein n=1 Tax=Megaselia scalaris TaxID=36166 RepID=T1GM65_MEGSC